jgi:uncharacterized protein YdbL (DUF1318 family)
MMIKLKNKYGRILPALSTIWLVLALFALPASALDLNQARAEKLVKETSSGYLVVVKPSADVDALVKKVNTGRKTAYQKIANKQSVPLSVVEQSAGKKLTK